MERGIVKRSTEPEVSVPAAIACGRQILSKRFARGRIEFSTETLRDSLAENGSFVDAVISAFTDEGLIEKQDVERSQEAPAGLFGLNPATYRICPRIVDVVVTTHLGLTFDATRMTIQRSDFCRHVVTLSPIQMSLAVAMCDGGDAGIVVSVATGMRGGDRSGERQFRTSFNRCLSVLGVKLERFAWKIIEK